MMNLLIDCAFSNMTIALVDQDVVCLKHQQAWQRQSELLAPAIKQMLAENHIDVKQITAVYVGAGPGSFTGTRIAMTFAKTFSYCAQIPLFTFNSFLLAAGAKGKKIILAPAKSSQFYYGAFEDGQEKECGSASKAELEQKYPLFQIASWDDIDITNNIAFVIKHSVIASNLTAAPRYR